MHSTCQRSQQFACPTSGCALQVVAPKRAMLGEANKKLEGAERKLTGIRAKVAELNAKVAALEANLMKATEDKNNAVAQVRACCSKRSRTTLLV